MTKKLISGDMETQGMEYYPYGSTTSLGDFWQAICHLLHFPIPWKTLLLDFLKQIGVVSVPAEVPMQAE